jgi:hypothetical protein
MRIAMVIVAAIMSYACGGDEERGGVGELGGSCYPNGTCNAGLQCVGAMCLGEDVDAGMDCAADDLEPNEAIQTASPTTFGSDRFVTIRSHACPRLDKDTYSVSITTASTNLEMLVYAPNLSDVSGGILDTNGNVVVATSQYSSMYLHAYAPALNVGTYYVQVVASRAPSDYELSLSITGP